MEWLIINFNFTIVDIKKCISWVCDTYNLDILEIIANNFILTADDVKNEYCRLIMQERSRGYNGKKIAFMEWLKNHFDLRITYGYMYGFN